MTGLGQRVQTKVVNLGTVYARLKDEEDLTGCGLLQSELTPNSRLYSMRKATLRENPWFELWHEMYLGRRSTLPEHTFSASRGTSHPAAEERQRKGRMQPSTLR